MPLLLSALLHLWEAVRRSAGFYPITTLYIVAALICTGLGAGFFTRTGGLILLGIVAILAVLVATWKELRNVKQMLGGQQSEMLERITAMEQALIDAGLPVPPEGPKEQQARFDRFKNRRDNTTA